MGNRYVGGIITSTGVIYLNTSNVAMARAATLDTSKFMDEPVTDLETLKKHGDDMKTQIELLILKIQVLLSNLIHSRGLPMVNVLRMHAMFFLNFWIIC